MNVRIEFIPHGERKPYWILVFLGVITVIVTVGYVVLSNQTSSTLNVDTSITVDVVTSSVKNLPWEDLQPFRGKTKTNGETGKNRRYYEWDYTHGDVEVYDRRGRHLGSMDPETGEMTKPAVAGRKIDL